VCVRVLACVWSTITATRQVRVYFSRINVPRSRLINPPSRRQQVA